jgi:hypothetical protein
MFRADDFRQYAQECIVSARVSKSDAIREHFLDMAKTWTIAAAQIDEGTTAAVHTPSPRSNAALTV